MTARRDPACAPSGALALLTGAIGYALAVCARVTPGEMALPTPCAEWDLQTLLAHLAASMADLESGLRTGSLDLESGLRTGSLDLESGLRTGSLDLESGLRTGSLDLDLADPAATANPATPGHPPGPESDRTQRAHGAEGAEGAGPPGGPVEVLRDQAANLLCTCYDHHDAGRPVLVAGLPLPAGIVAYTGAVEIAVHGWDVAAARGRREEIPSGLASQMLGMSPLLVESRAGLFAPPVEISPQASPGDRLVAYLGRRPR